MPDPRPNNLLHNIAANANRTQLHGTRRLEDNGKARPAGVLTGQQAVCDPAVDLPAGVEIYYGAGAAPVATILPPLPVVNSFTAAAEGALTAPEAQGYFNLQYDEDLPTWVYHARTFSLPDKPVNEDCLDLPEGRFIQHLTPSMLHEAAATSADGAGPGLPEVALCKVKKEQAKGDAGASRNVLSEIPNTSWCPAGLFRCPLRAAWKVKQDDGFAPVYELGGIPQGERWYLDQLGLLEKPGSVPAGVPGIQQVQMFLEWPPVDIKTPPDRQEICRWSLARRNPTSLARPDMSVSALAHTAATDDLPYTASSGESDPRNALRLLDMASIANSGGYYLQAIEVVETPPTAADTVLTLVVCVTYKTQPDANPGYKGLPLPSAANALVFDAAQRNDLVLRFDGDEHINAQPYAPLGCLTFGWRRDLPPGAGQPEITPASFAGDVHLIDYTVSEQTDTDVWHPIDEYRSVVPEGQLKPVMVSVPCVGETGPALSPVSQTPDSPEELRGRKRLPRAARSLDAFLHPGATRRRSSSTSGAANPASHYYRATVRYATENFYQRLADPIGSNPPKSNLKISAAFRDVYGDRIQPAFADRVDFWSKILTLCYTDTLIAPADWPGFHFRLTPAGAGKVVLNAQYLKHDGAPSSADTADADEQRKNRLKIVFEQLRGVDEDVTVSLGTAGDPANELFRFTSSADLRAALMGMLQRIVEHDLDAEALAPVTFTVEPRFTDDDPKPFLPVLRVSRSPEHLPPSDLFEGDAPAVAEAIKKQVGEAVSAVPLGRLGFPATPVSTPPAQGQPLEGDEFLRVAQAFEPVFTFGGVAFHAAICCNRYNEHELWVVSPSALPSRPAQLADPAYATVQPLSTVLGQGSFTMPDFSHADPQGTNSANQWHGFSIDTDSPEKFAGIDYDAYARRGFAFWEDVLEPRRLTESDAPGKDDRLWDNVLRQKDALATALGRQDTGWVVPMTVEQNGAMPNPLGIQRMATDAFQRDLRQFYDVDTFLQLGIGLPKAVPQISNFYGNVTASFETTQNHGPATPEPAPARYSDFVIRMAEDKDTGVLTLLYDLAPYKERAWQTWKTKDLTANVTHVQLTLVGEGSPGDALRRKRARPRAGSTDPFDRGQWLELATAVSIKLQDTDGWAVPAIERSFPADPTLSAALVVPPPDPILLEQMPQWQWQVDYALETPVVNADGTVEPINENDIVYLALTYNEPETALTAKRSATTSQWQTENLLHDLLVLDRLSAVPRGDWVTQTNNDKGSQLRRCLADLLEWTAGHLESHLIGTEMRPTGHSTAAPHPQPTTSTLTASPDRFALQLTHSPQLLGPAAPVLSEGNPATTKLRAALWSQTAPSQYTVKANPATPAGSADQLHLLSGANRAISFLPTLIRVRNKLELQIGGVTRHVDPRLVYTCRPVTWPAAVPVARRFPDVMTVSTLVDPTLETIAATPPVALSAAIQAALNKLGAAAACLPGRTFDLRVRLSHGFLMGANLVKVVTPFTMLPADYTLPSAEASLATAIAKTYCCWLAGVSLNSYGPTVLAAAKAVLAGVHNPVLRLSLQFTPLATSGSDSSYLRTLLEIEALEFDSRNPG